jgi:hypothetical protein
LLVSRSSSTPVAAWAWPTWVVSRRHVLEAVFGLLESPSPSRRIFIGSHSLPPLWFVVSVLRLKKLNVTGITGCPLLISLDCTLAVLYVTDIDYW